MGTEVHYRSYFARDSKMRDHNVNADGSWPSLYINKTLNEHFYNGFFPSPSNGYSTYDKEMLKRTMLEHEAIFKKQVYELHRLYGIQKDLMEKFQKNGLSGFSKHKVPLKTTSLSQVQPECATRNSQMPLRCSIKNNQKNKKAKYNDEIISSVNYLENSQQSSDFHETENLQRVDESDFSFKKCSKRMLDFQPLDSAYIDDAVRSVEKIPGSCDRGSAIELNLNLVNASGSSRKDDVCESNYLNSNSLFTVMDDHLHEPNRQEIFKGAPYSFPVKVFEPRIQTEEDCRLKFPFSLTSLSLQNAFPEDDDSGERTLSNAFQGVEEEISSGSVCHDEADFAGKPLRKSFENSTLHVEKDPMFSESAKTNFNNFSDTISSDRNETAKSFKQESNGTTLPPVSTSVKPLNDENHSPNPISAISSFDGLSKAKKISSSDTSTKDLNDASENCRAGIDLNSPLIFEKKSSSCFNGVNDGTHLKSNSSIFNINLNFEVENSLTGTQGGLTAQQNKLAKDLDGRCEDFLPGFSCCPKGKPACESLEPTSKKINGVYENKSEDRARLPSCNLEVFLTPLHRKYSKTQNNHISDNTIEQNLSSSLNEVKQIIDGDIKMYSSQKSTFAENIGNSFRNCIDLNSVFPLADVSDSSDISTFPSTRAAPLIETEEPAMALLEDNLTYAIPSTPLCSNKGLQEELCSSEICVKEAAENIINLSLDVFKQKDDIHGPSSSTSLNNALYLLAETVLSNNNSIELNAQHDQDDDLDLFELMTLQLEETKPERLWCGSPHEAENMEANKRSKALLLLTKSRRAQGKKRRQKKNFQKDILPALATLSRQESMEDLEAIGELMKACGTPWQVGIRRRKMRRNGAQAQAGRKRQRNPPARINSMAALFMVDGSYCNHELEVDRKQNMVGWGRTTRRCRSQRCMQMSITSTLM